MADAQKAGLPTFDLIICDEAHRTTGVTLAGQDESHFVKIHDADFIKGTKRLDNSTASVTDFQGDTGHMSRAVAFSRSIKGNQK